MFIASFCCGLVDLVLSPFLILSLLSVTRTVDVFAAMREAWNQAYDEPWIPWAGWFSCGWQAFVDLLHLPLFLWVCVTLVRIPGLCNHRENFESFREAVRVNAVLVLASGVPP